MPLTTPPVWTQAFDDLTEVRDPAGLAILHAAREIDVPQGTVVFRSGDECQSYLLVLAGSIRVQQTAANGREIVLYRVQEGDSCVLTTSCLLGRTHYCAEGVTETPVHAIAIPVERFNEGLEQSPAFRRFVFHSFGRRISDLMLLIEDVAFGRLDARLAERLLALVGDAASLDRTHQELATELGSAREVVSRALKDFERRGWVQLHRGRVEIVDRRALQTLAEEV
ncbi:MAG: Crp/Fnr family transcriptional regulator [Chromatiales bacterium]|jgi:CRP/FNR family transcriptional regulator|nr:Crp/Fnr family transcriptional regulator [Chromatiales bacterium]MDX9766769.1 Crp/Fnr family transcriptional regulator [Ectothiorhodospiraceae bacterium]